MSGQVSSTEYDQILSVDFETTEDIATQLGIEDRAVSDPVADFLEKHGQELTPDHEGNLVTWYEAVTNCPPLRALVQAMGEAVLGMTASVHTPETDEVESEEAKTEEIKTDEETEDRAKQKEEVEQSGQETANRQQDVGTTSVQETQNTQQLHISQTLRQELTTRGNLPVETEVVDRQSGSGGNVSPTNAVNEKPRAAKRAADEINTQPSELSPKPVLRARDVPTSKAKVAQSKDVKTLPESTSDSTAEVEEEELVETRLEGEQETTMSTGTSPIVLAEQGDEVQLISEELYRIPELTSESVFTTDDEIEDGMPEATEFIPELLADVLQLGPEDLLKSEMEEIEWEGSSSEQVNEAQPLALPEDYQGSSGILGELTVPAEEVQEAIQKIGEHIERMEDEETEAVNQILDEILQKVNEVHSLIEADVPELEETLAADQAECELRELFIQLFERTEMEYSEELVQSSVSLVLKDDASVLISALEQEEDIASQGIGTHEVIKYLLTAVDNAKRAIAHAYHLGKSALKLYSQRLTPHPSR